MTSSLIRIENISVAPLVGRTIEIALGQLVAIVGPSASGKSRLLNNVIPEFCSRAGHEVVQFVNFQKYRPLDSLASVLGLSKLIAELFAATFEARSMGCQAADFQIENPKSRYRCQVCSGFGLEQILANMTVGSQFAQLETSQKCVECLGRRFQSRLLKVRYGGIDIAAVLNSTVEQALSIFWKESTLVRKMMLVRRFGFSATKLGDFVNEMNAAEKQRLWLCKILAPHMEYSRNSKLVFLFDNPCLGLNSTDRKEVLSVFRNLVGNGDSVICVDNSPSLSETADSIIRL